MIPNTVREYRRRVRHASTADLIAQLADRGLVPAAYPTDRARRNALLALVDGMNGNDPVPFPLPAAAWAAVAPNPRRELYLRLLAVFIATQLFFDAVAIVTLATTAPDRAIVVLTVVLTLTLIESVGGLVAVFWPGLLAVLGNRPVRALAYTSAVAILFEALALAVLWEVFGDMRDGTTLVLMWGCIVTFTVLDVVGSVTVLVRE